jgi:hypothetical protein
MGAPFRDGLLPFGSDPQAVPPVPAAIPSAAIISDCGKYRYRLERSGYGLGKTAIIMVNPSTADATQDDATIRKLKGFGQRNAWGDLIVGNLFAYRATDVRELASAADPIGPENDAHLKRIISRADQVIFAWGPVSKVPRRLRDRWRTVDALVRSSGFQPYSIGVPAKCGHPRHPLMLAYVEPILPWEQVA